MGSSGGHCSSRYVIHLDETRQNGGLIYCFSAVSPFFLDAEPKTSYVACQTL
jgi:hypothetical protein